MNESSEQAEQLWTAEIEPFNPQPDEWYSAIVKRGRNGYGFAELENLDRVFISQAVVQPEAGHSCLRRHEAVFVRIRRSAPNKRTKWDALECQYATTRELPKEERGVIDALSATGKSYYISLTPCGCYTRGLADDDLLDIGQSVVLTDFRGDRDLPGRIIAGTVRRADET